MFNLTVHFLCVQSHLLKYLTKHCCLRERNGFLVISSWLNLFCQFVCWKSVIFFFLSIVLSYSINVYVKLYSKCACKVLWFVIVLYFIMFMIYIRIMKGQHMASITCPNKRKKIKKLKKIYINKIRLRREFDENDLMKTSYCFSWWILWILNLFVTYNESIKG